MAKFIRLVPYKIYGPNHYQAEVAYVNIEQISDVYKKDEDFIQINMINGDSIVVEMAIDKFMENLRNEK